MFGRKKDKPKKVPAGAAAKAPAVPQDVDTASTASLVGGDASKPPFHGLFNERVRPYLQYERESDSPILSTVHLQESDSKDLLMLSGVANKMRYTIFVAKAAGDKARIEKLVADIFAKINAIVNGWSKSSEISKLNNAPADKNLTISKDLAQVFDVVDQVHSISDGLFDPTAGVIKLAYFQTLADGGIPLPNDMKKFRFAMGWSKRIVRKKDATSVKKTNGNTIIDLDGISKGYCVDLILTAIKAAGYNDVYVDWGGDIRVSGQHPSGRSWRTAVLRPPELQRLFGHWTDKTLDKMLGEDDVGYTVDLKEGAIATSGDYFQMQKFGYHHIVRAADTAPLKATSKSLGSVSVHASSCAVADGLATAAMTFDSPANAVDFLKKVAAKRPNEVFGYCVIGRGAGGVKPEFATSQFVSQIADLAPVAGATTSQSTEVSDSDLASIKRALVYVPGQLSWGKNTYIVDSMVSCSIDLEAIASFFVPADVGKKLEEYMDKEETIDYRIASDVNKFDSLHLMFKIDSVFNEGDTCLVLAQIEDIVASKNDAIQVQGGDKSIRIKLAPSIKDTRFKFSEVTQKAKKFFSEIPASICVLTTKGADGCTYALTATSVARTEHAPKLISFNVMHTSRFYAGMGPEGSIITIHCLGKDGKKVAQTHTKDGAVKNNDTSGIVNASTVVLNASVKKIENAYEHAIITAEVQNVALGKESESLVWHRRSYITLS